MSFDSVGRAFSAKLPSTEKLLLITLAHIENHETRACHPSRKYLADIVGISERYVSKVTAKLEALGHLKIQPRYGKDGNQVGNNYILTIKDENTPIDPQDKGGCHIGAGSLQPSSTPLEPQVQTPLSPSSTRTENTNREINREPPPTPPDLDSNAWSDYEQHRREKKKTMTPLARQRGQSKLIKLARETGIPQQEIVDHSVANGWTGLFAPDQSKQTQEEKYALRNRRLNAELSGHRHHDTAHDRRMLPTFFDLKKS